jgi:hypothetical protein
MVQARVVSLIASRVTVLSTAQSMVQARVVSLIASRVTVLSTAAVLLAVTIHVTKSYAISRFIYPRIYDSISISNCLLS